MGSDDDTIIIRGKVSKFLSAPVASAKRWHVGAYLVACFLLGAWIF